MERIWWYISLNEKLIMIGKQQPTKILNLKEVFEKAFAAIQIESNEHSYELKDIEQAVIANKPNPYIQRTAHFTWLLLLLNCAIFLLMLVSGSRQIVIEAFGNEPNMVIHAGQYYRLITSIFIHGDFAHISMNMVYLYAFGMVGEKLFGSKRYIILYFLSGIFGSVASLLFTQYLSVGASGAIYGVIGAVYIYSKKRGNYGLMFSNITMLTLIVIGICVGFATPNVDNFAHIGGLMTGIVCGGGFIVEKKKNI